MPQAALTPWVHTLFEPLDDAARELLGLGPEVAVQARPSGPAVLAVLTIPDGEQLTLRLTLDGTLQVREAAEGPALDTIQRLHRAWQRKDGPTLNAALATAHATTAPYASLRDDMFRRVFRGVTGTTGNLRLGFGCNQDCGLCWQNRRWPGAPRVLLETWIDELAEAGVTQLTFTGGEPTLRKELPDLVARARDHGMKTLVQTNAVMLTRERFLARLVEARVDRLFVSLHAADPDISDRITAAPGTHAHTVAGTKAALAAGLRVGLSVVVDALNVDHLPDHARFVVARLPGVESVTWSRPQPYHDRTLWEQRLVPNDLVGPPLREAVAIVAAAGIVCDVTSGSCGLPPCLIANTPEHIHLPPPQLDPQGRPTVDHADDAICRQCALGPRCPGPSVAYRQLYGDRGLVPFAEAPALRPFPLSL